MRKSWPLILIIAGVFLIPFGFALATSGGAIAGVVFFSLGLTVFLVGSVTVTIRFAVRRRLVPHLLCALAALLLVALGINKYCFSLAYIRGAQEDSYQLWMSALKPFGGQVYYVGSEGDFSFFRAGAVFPARYKAPTANIRLPRTFPLGAQEPYAVTEGMVHY
jgi:hypothetical protein